MAFRYSNFPQSIDKLKRLPEYQELSAEDKSYVARYTELCQKGASMTTQDKLEFNDLLNNKLRDKMIQSVDWNLIADAITNIEDFYLNHVLKDISDLVNRKEQEFTNYIDNKTSYFNGYIDIKTNYFKEYVDNNTEHFNKKLDRFNYKEDYNANTDYEPWNTILFKDNIFICKKACKNILPTNEEYWVKMARHGEGVRWKKTWSPAITYRPLDIVEHDNSLFICILDNYNKIPTDNQSENNQYWDLMFTNRSNSTNQYYKNYKDGRVIIEHNLGIFPEVQAISQCTYGHGGYGLFQLYNNYQLHTVIEYIDQNNIRLYFVERFNGVPTLTKIKEKEYSIKYSLEDTEIRIFLK